MQTKVTQLKTPDLMNTKARKHSDSPVFKTPLSNALGLGKASFVNKQHWMPKQIVTPNLEFIKQSKAKQGQNGSGRKKLIMFTTESIDDLEQGDCETTCGTKEGLIFCHSHPSKKAKYFLERNVSIGLCTKCAISIGQTEPLLDEQKYYKVAEIQKFREMARKVECIIQNKNSDKQCYISDLHKQCAIAIQIVNQEFESLLKHIKQKRQSLIKEVQKKYTQAITNIEEHSKKLITIQQSISRYLQDIDNNYSSIVHSLHRDQFDGIMQRYHYKIDENLMKINQDVRLTHRMDLMRMDIKPLKVMIDGVTFFRKEKDAEKENQHNSLNMKNVRGKPKTPYRKAI